jgi:spore coat protein U-like protein
MIARWIFVVAAVLFFIGIQSSPSQAVSTCTLTTVGVAFGNYNVYTATATTANGKVKVECNFADTIQVSLNPGVNSGGFPNRYMASGTNLLSYNLYLDATFMTIWGDGTGGTSIYGPTAITPTGSLTVTVYGQIPALQDVTLGSYTDTITATLSY